MSVEIGNRVTALSSSLLCRGVQCGPTFRASSSPIVYLIEWLESSRNSWTHAHNTGSDGLGFPELNDNGELKDVAASCGWRDGGMEGWGDEGIEVWPVKMIEVMIANCLQAE